MTPTQPPGLRADERELTPLPQPTLEDHDYELWGQNVRGDFFTAEQMHAYARAALTSQPAPAESPAPVQQVGELFAYVHKRGTEDEEFIHAVAVNGNCADCEPLFLGAALTPQPATSEEREGLVQRLRDSSRDEALTIGAAWNLLEEAADALAQPDAPAVPMCSEQAVLHALTMARSETHKQGDAALWQAFGRAMWRQFNAMLAATPPQQAEPYCHVYEYDTPLGLHRALYPKQWNGKLPDRTVPVYTHPTPAAPSDPQPKGALPEAHQDGWNERYNCLAAGPTATDVALHQAMNEAAKIGNRDDDKLIRKALNAAGYYLVRSMKKPATPAEAEELAKKAVGDYLNACRMTDRDQIGNYLMKLCSVAGVVMAQAEGSVAAADRLSGTAAFIFKSMPENPARLEPLR